MIIPDFSQFNFSTDIVILLTVALVVMSGVLLGHHKVKTFALSVYVGIVLATELGKVVANFLTSHGVHVLTLGQTRLLLFIVPIIILEFGRKEHYKKGARGSFIMTLVLSVLVAALIIASVLQLLEPGTQKSLLDGSSLAWPFYRLRLWWIAAVPIAVLFESFVRGKRGD